MASRESRVHSHDEPPMFIELFDLVDEQTPVVIEA